MSSNKEYLPYLARAYRWLPVTEGQQGLPISQMATEYLENIKECLETGSLVPHEFLRCSPEETLTANLWVEVIEYELSRRVKRGIWWLAVEYDDIAQMLCPPNIYETTYHALYGGKRHVEHIHVTLAFDVTEHGRPLTHNDKWGGDSDCFPIRVKGLAHNSKCACLVVDIGDTDCCNKHPHITLALAEGVQPVYSNDMLAGKDGPYTYLPLEATLEGRLEFKPFD